MQTITKIVITGGPCAGKSSAMELIRRTFSAKGYTVLIVPETATELISGGVAPWTCGTNCEYQKIQVSTQLFKEKMFLQAASTMPGEKILIVCDRGTMDNRAYMNEAEYSEVLEYVGETTESLLFRYDIVFHLETTAKGASAYYTLANNAARYENVEDAVALDDRLIESWSGHPNLKIIPSQIGFEPKMEHLLNEISNFLDNCEAI